MKNIIKIYPFRILEIHIEDNGVPYIWIGSIRNGEVKMFGFLSRKAMYKLYKIFKNFFEKEIYE